MRRTESAGDDARDGRPRQRRPRALALLAVIAVGLVWRSDVLALPASVAQYGADALWALAVFLVVGLLLPRASATHVALIAMGLATLVELSQLVRTDWLDAARFTWLGALTLGSTFDAWDLPAYAAGVLVGWATDPGLARASRSA